jgi:AhpD family alkylhydroperoxidase
MAKKKPWYVENAPDLGEKFQEFHDACNKGGVLDKKVKELLMTVLACTHRCPHCTNEHIQRALDAGCTKQEVSEALLIAAVEGAGTQLYWAKSTFDKHLGGGAK